MPAKIDPRSLEMVQSGPVQGMIPVTDTIEGERVTHLIPWNKAARQHSKSRGETEDQWVLPDPTEADITEQAIKTLPPDVHIPHRDRYQMLVRKLFADATATFMRTGYVQWPKSVEDELRKMGWLSGQPTLLEQVEALAAKYIVEASNHQKQQDAHRSTTPGNARYSA